MKSVIEGFLQWKMEEHISFAPGSAQDVGTKKLVELEQELYALLPEHHELIERYNHVQGDVLLAELDDYFIDGFCTGARLMLELLTGIKAPGRREITVKFDDDLYYCCEIIRIVVEKWGELDPTDGAF